MEPAHNCDVDDSDVRLSDLVEDVKSGHEVILNAHGEPVAKVIPLRTGPILRRPGGWEGRLVIHDDFDELDEETLAAFRGQRP